MDRITHQSSRQRGYGSTSSPRNNSLKHTRKHERRKGGIEPRSKAHSLWRTVRPDRADRPRWAARIVRQGTADCPHPCRGMSGLSRGPSVKANRTSSGTPRTTDRPRGARGLSARHPWTVRPTHADRPKCRPTKTKNHDGSKRKASKNSKNTGRTRAARTVRQEGADRTRGTDRAEKRPTSKVNYPKSSSDFPNGGSCVDKGLGT
jgi:hypothetical protein